MTLHVVDTEATRALRTDPAGETAAVAPRNLAWTSSDVFAADRDRWESVGKVGDVVMTQDGAIRGVLVDIGGFLGLFARSVMIDLDDLYFVADDTTPENLSDFFLVATYSRDQLESMPEWDGARLSEGFAPRSAVHAPDLPRDHAGTETGILPGMGAAPARGEAGNEAAPRATFGATLSPAEEGYMPVEPVTLTADSLIGASVHDAEGSEVGSVEDLVIGTPSGISEVIVDVGGFLGIGAHTVALPVEAAEFWWNSESNDMRILTALTRDQMEAMPEYRG